jgi:predicted lipoprotein
MTSSSSLRLTNILLIASCAFLILATGCKKKEDAADCSVFNRQAYLENLALHTIIPAYAAYSQQVDNLQESCETFVEEPSLENLGICRTKFHSASLSWQYVAMFNFGPADVLALQASTNTYPADTAMINTKIASSDFDIETVSSLAARGFPTLDYLLHGPISFGDQDMLNLFIVDENATSRKEYLATLTTAMADQASIVVQTWSSTGGDYLSEFTSNTGTAVGSSIGLFLNAFNKSYESHTRTEKVGIPVGALTFSQAPLPDRVEGYFGQSNSQEYLMASILAFENLFLGDGIDDENYSGLDDYLSSLDAQYNGDQLTVEIGYQIDAVKMGVESIIPPFSQYVDVNQVEAFSLYADMQKLNVLWKVDMMSALGILITYQDNDGD